MLMALYIFNVFAVGYIVFALERNHGTCMQYKDVAWIMGVTITNLGFGDFTPSFWLSRTIGFIHQIPDITQELSAVFLH